MAAEKVPRKKKKKHHPILDWLLCAAVRILVIFLFLFDVETNLRFACVLGDLLWKHYRRGRDRALENLRASFPDKSEDWIHATGRRSFQQLVMLTIDILFTPRLVRKHNWRQYSRFSEGTEQVKWMMHERKGLLMVTAHYGNFEILGYMMGLFGFDTYNIARPLDNKYLNRFLYGVRERRGQKLIDKKGAAELMPSLVQQGSTVGFIADQDAGRKGVFVDFFGRKASTYKSIGLLALTYNLPIVVGCSRRVGNRFFFEMGNTRIIFPHEWADKDDPLLWVSQEYTKAIETFVREDPTQYWWVHRRWKTRPKEERRAAEAQAALAGTPNELNGRRSGQPTSSPDVSVPSA
ncbi:MAG: lysophospholipid acyltransferase family protein [Phycisphaerae bacterium]|nr:lysophospholipid acyltransferase family protein [Phycisphaerae bacterium]